MDLLYFGYDAQKEKVTFFKHYAFNNSGGAMRFLLQ